MGLRNGTGLDTGEARWGGARQRIVALPAVSSAVNPAATGEANLAPGAQPASSLDAGGSPVPDFRWL